jgi:acyl-CoA thioester hydrolase
MAAQPFYVDEYVRWSDVDHAGIIYYGSYVRFFEIAETEMFRDLGAPYSVLFDRFDMWLPRVHLEVDFLYPPRLDDRLRVATYFTKFGNSSIHINFDVWHVSSGKMAAQAKEVLVCTDRTTLKSKPLPEDLLALLKGHLVEEDVARNDRTI